MNTNLNTFLKIAIFLFAPLVSIGQQVEFSQFYSAPLHLNPALAGISHGPRLSMTYRNQWPELTTGPNGGFTTYAVSYDQHIEAIQGGIGIQFISDRIANDKIVDNSVAITYAYQLRIKDKVGIKFGIGGSYKHRYINFHDLTFLDQIDPINGFTQTTGITYNTNEPPPSNFNRNIFNANAGIALFTQKYYGGLAFTNILPEKDFYNDQTSRLRMAAHAGALFKFGKNPFKQKFFIAPQALYVYQNNFHQITLGSMVGYDFVYLSLWGRHNIKNMESVIVGLGFKKSVIRFGYSYDINVSPLKGTAGSHEFTFAFNFTKEDNSLNPSYRQGRMPCPYYLDF